MIFHIAVCSPDPVLRGRVERQCLEYYARRADACIVEQLPGVDALLAGTPRVPGTSSTLWS